MITFDPQMRVRIVVFFVSLCFLLLGGGHYLHAAGMNHNLVPKSLSRTLGKNHQVKFTGSDQGGTVIEDADLDLEEEYLSGHDVDGGANKFFAGKYNLQGRWYLTFSPQSILNDYYKSFKIFMPFCGNSSPIYITQRVLRI